MLSPERDGTRSHPDLPLPHYARPRSVSFGTVAAWHFFRGQAGRVGFAAVDGMSLARAERAAKDAGAYVRWEADEAEWESDIPDYMPETVECADLVVPCVCCGHPRVLASLCGIADADDGYRRVVGAQLALEAGYGAR